MTAPGEGFNDPTPAAPVGGNTGTTLGQQRLIAFQHAADIWGAELDTNSDHSCSRRIQSAPAERSRQRRARSRVFTISTAPAFIRVRNFRRHGMAPHSPTSVPAQDLWSTRTDDPDIERPVQQQLQFLPRPRQQPRRAERPGCRAAARARARSELPEFRQRNDRNELLRSNRHLRASHVRFDEQPVLGPDDRRAAPASATRFGRVVWEGTNVEAGIPVGAVIRQPRVANPLACRHAGPFQFGTASFGAPITSPGVTGTVVAARDASGKWPGPATTDGCTALTNGSGYRRARSRWSNAGTCTFQTKASNAQIAGAMAVIIYNNAANVNGAPPGMAADPMAGPVTITTVSVTRPDGLYHPRPAGRQRQRASRDRSDHSRRCRHARPGASLHAVPRGAGIFGLALRLGRLSQSPDGARDQRRPHAQRESASGLDAGVTQRCRLVPR